MTVVNEDTTVKREWDGRCAYLAKGFCAASIDGYCIGGYFGCDNEHEHDPICHG